MSDYQAALADIQEQIRQIEANQAEDFDGSCTAVIIDMPHAKAILKAAQSEAKQPVSPYLPLPWHYEHEGIDGTGERWGNLFSENGKMVAESVYEKDWYAIKDAMGSRSKYVNCEGSKP